MEVQNAKGWAPVLHTSEGRPHRLCARIAIPIVVAVAAACVAITCVGVIDTFGNMLLPLPLLIKANHVVYHTRQTLQGTLH